MVGLPAVYRMRRFAREGGQQGYALLAALLIIAIALLSSATLVAAVLSATAITADDAASVRATDAADAGVADALDRLRWGRLSLDSAARAATLGPVTFAGGSYTVTVAAMPAGSSGALLDSASPIDPDDPAVGAFSIDAHGVWGRARTELHVVALATPDGLPRGVVASDGVTLAAPTVLRSCGLYSGGDVSGREWLTVGAALGAPPASGGASLNVSDLAYGRLFPLTGVHADGHILVDGVDEHLGPDAPAADSDVDSGTTPPADLLAAPTAAVIGELAAHASPAIAAQGPFGLDLALLDQAVPPALGEPWAPAGGRVYVVAPSGGALNVFGSRNSAPQACPATVVVVGDCEVCAGPSGQGAAALNGALVVTGTLTVDAPFSLDGSLYAGRLVVRAPLTVSFAAASGPSAAPGTTNVRAASLRQ
jgi:hypothetical protein